MLSEKQERIHISHLVNVPCPENVINADDILMVETQQDLDFSQCALAVRLVLKRADFLDGDTLACQVVRGRAGQGRKHTTGLILHTAGFTDSDGIRNWAGARLPLQKRCICDTRLFAVTCCEVVWVSA